MELWTRERIYSFANVLLRVPPLFVIDELLRIGLGVQDEPVTIALNMTESGFKMMESGDGALESIVTAAGNSVIIAEKWSEMYNLQPSYQMFFMTTSKFIACCFGCLAAMCTFMLYTKHLIVVYLYLMSVGIVFVSYWSNLSTIEAIITYLNSKESGSSSILAEILNLQFSQLMYNGPGLQIIQNYIFQSVLALIFCYIHLGPRHALLQKALACSFTVPSHIGLYPLPTTFMLQAPVCAALVPLGVCKIALWCNTPKIWKTFFVGYQVSRNFIAIYGLSVLAETQWTRLHVPSVLRTFWILRVAEQVFQMMSKNYGDETFNYYIMIKTLMVNGCETLTAVLGMTSIVSVICHYIGSFFHWVLLIDDEDEKSIGTVSAMLFYILALQTGLTSLDKENRLLRLCRNLCLLFTAVLHFVHNIVNPLLMALSASHNPTLHRHIRALGVCIFLIVFPVWLLTFLWSHYTISTWLLAVTVFSIEVIVKVFVSLAIYSLFLYDAYHKSFWEKLDDWVYIIRAFGNIVEFAFGIILFFNGFWILVFEAGGTIRAVMMCVHAYFNLWCEAKAGWSVFMKRRHAVNKINLLPEATDRQLREHADVCAICYHEMKSAKITRCNHFFHGDCLRKWLYVQDVCPLCHNIMYKTENQRLENDASEAPGENREEDHNTVNDQGNPFEEIHAANQTNARNFTARASTSEASNQPQQAAEER